jgi:hypothetical protein
MTYYFLQFSFRCILRSLKLAPRKLVPRSFVVDAIIVGGGSGHGREEQDLTRIPERFREMAGSEALLGASRLRSEPTPPE